MNSPYRLEIIFDGLQCVKYTYGYVNGEKISEVSEVVSEFAPYDNTDYGYEFVGYTDLHNKNGEFWTVNGLDYTNSKLITDEFSL